jgi:hypothetical protein
MRRGGDLKLSVGFLNLKEMKKFKVQIACYG